MKRILFFSSLLLLVFVVAAMFAPAVLADKPDGKNTPAAKVTQGSGQSSSSSSSDQGQHLGSTPKPSDDRGRGDDANAPKDNNCDDKGPDGKCKDKTPPPCKDDCDDHKKTKTPGPCGDDDCRTETPPPCKGNCKTVTPPPTGRPSETPVPSATVPSTNGGNNGTGGTTTAAMCVTCTLQIVFVGQQDGAAIAVYDAAASTTPITTFTGVGPMFFNVPTGHTLTVVRNSRAVAVIAPIVCGGYVIADVDVSGLKIETGTDMVNVVNFPPK